MGSQQFLDPRKMGPSQQDAELRMCFYFLISLVTFKTSVRIQSACLSLFGSCLPTSIIDLGNLCRPNLWLQRRWFSTRLLSKWLKGTIVNCAKVIVVFGYSLGKHQQQHRLPTLSPCHPLGDLLKDAMSLEMDDSLEELRWDHLEIQCCLSGARVYWKYWPTSDSMGV